MNGIYHRDATFGNVLNEVKKKSGYDRFERVYVGSSFCAQYFLGTSKDLLRALCLFCEKEQMKMTLVLPMFAQKYVQAGKEKTVELLSVAGDYIDEITVNDYGMMQYFTNCYHYPLFLGRLLAKDYREIRYESYFQTACEPKIFNQTMTEFLKNYPIKGVELDPTHAVIQLSEAPNNYVIGVHYPYCYQTVGNICEAASVHKELTQKFRPNHPCHMECETLLQHFCDDEQNEYIKHGRSVYFLNDKVKIEGKDHIRLIYSEAML